MPSDFGYINARVKAMRSRLLPPGRVEELLALPDLDGFLRALGTTAYAPEPLLLPAFGAAAKALPPNGLACR